VSNPSSTRLRRTAPATVAATLACCYSVVLTVLAVLLVVEWTTGQGVIGNLSSNAANRGVAFFIAACVAGAVLLVLGALSAWRGRRGLAAIIPLAIIVVVGCIGEPIDIASGNPPTDNLIGGGIIIAAALPLLLLVLPRTDNR
jgi:hypothetical protein